jgi:surface protein
MNSMFVFSKFNGDLSKWDVSNVETMSYMFCRSEFNQDISNWLIKSGVDTRKMFLSCPIKNAYKPKN